MFMKIKDICHINLSSITSNDEIENILYLDTSNLCENVIGCLQPFMLSEAPSRAQRKVKHKTILYSMVRPNQKHFGIMDNPSDNLIASTGFVTIDVKNEEKENYDAHFLYYILSQNWVTSYLQTIAENSVSSYPSINPSDIGNLNFTFPKIEVQRQIAAVLKNIDNKIALNRAINQNLEKMAKQLYDYWFVQFDFPNEEGKPYKSSGGKMVWNEKLKREIPIGWFASNICRIADILSGGTPSKTVPQYWENGDIPFFGPTDCNGNCFQIETADHITKDGLAHCSSSLFEEGTVIITARGSIGKLVIVGTPMAMNQSCYALRSKTKEFEYLFFLTIQLIEYLKAKGNGSVFKSIIASDIENSLLCIADNNTITEFCNVVRPLFKKIKENTLEYLGLTKQRDELLPLLMNGQVSPQNCD